MCWILLVLLFKHTTPPALSQTLQTINIMFINEAQNQLAEKSFDVVLNYLKKNPKLGVKVDAAVTVSISGTDAKAILESMCEAYNGTVSAGKPPHVILDSTMANVPSEAVKTFTDALALPTVSSSFGQEGDLRQWRNLDGEKLKYLIQINPPADIIPEIIRSIVQLQNITNAGILYDDSFVMEYKYKSLLINMATRHIIVHISDAQSIRTQLTRFRDLDIVNFFVLGRLSTIKIALETANANKYFGRKYAWHVITQDKGQLTCSCNNASVLHVKPEPEPGNKERLDSLRNSFNLIEEPEITSAFYFDFFLHSILAVKSLLDADEWPKEFNYTLCDDYREDREIVRKDIDLMKYMKTVSEPYSYAPFLLEKNGRSFQEFIMKLEKVTIINSQSESAESMGTWKAGLSSSIILRDSTAMNNFSAVTVYRVVTVKQHPFVIEYQKDGETKFKGYCIDLIEEIRGLVGFEYEIYVAPDNQFGNMDDNGNWNGMIKELVEKRAEIALGSLSVMAERENVVDFTVPYYDLVGITILMKKQTTATSLFKFLTVLENDVWLCILAAYFFTRNYNQLHKEALAVIYGVLKFHQYLYGPKFTIFTDHESFLFTETKNIPVRAAERSIRWSMILSSYDYKIELKEGVNIPHADAMSHLPNNSFLMWVFDRWSPYSYQNNREKYKDDEEKREFNLKECLWFCMTSLTPQGGGEAPKNLSGRLVAATWWLFGFIIIASYTANLAAFLTVSRLDQPIESLDDLAKQYKIQYAPINGSSAMTYFERMANIEKRFYEIWKDMSLNDSLSDVERAKLAVWDYPVSDKYTKMWQAMKEAKLPNTLEEALERVRSSKSSSEGFAFLGDATDIRYQQLVDCEFQMVGDEFSRKPYAIAVQQGSPLKDQFNNAILQLLNKRKLEKLKERWWSENPERQKCEKQDDQSDGISIHNIGGVFIVIFVGIGLACITLGFEYWWYKYKRPSGDLGGAPVVVKPSIGGGRNVEKLSVTGLADFSHHPTFRARNTYNANMRRGNVNQPPVSQW